MALPTALLTIRHSVVCSIASEFAVHDAIKSTGGKDEGSSVTRYTVPLNKIALSTIVCPAMNKMSNESFKGLHTPFGINARVCDAHQERV